jgi:hypothetical protein
MQGRRENRTRPAWSAHTKRMGEYCRGLTAHSTLRCTVWATPVLLCNEKPRPLDVLQQALAVGQSCGESYDESEQRRAAVSMTSAPGPYKCTVSPYNHSICTVHLTYAYPPELRVARHPQQLLHELAQPAPRLRWQLRAAQRVGLCMHASASQAPRIHVRLWSSALKCTKFRTIRLPSTISTKCTEFRTIRLQNVLNFVLQNAK